MTYSKNRSKKRVKRRTHKKSKKKRRKRTIRMNHNMKQPFHVSGSNIKKNKLKLSYDIFGKREIVGISNYRAMQALDNLNRITKMKKSDSRYEHLLDEYKRRLYLLLKHNRNKLMYKKIIGRSYTKKGLNKLPISKLEKLYFILLNY